MNVASVLLFFKTFESFASGLLCFVSIYGILYMYRFTLFTSPQKERKSF